MTEQRLLIRNYIGTTIDLWIEPWGEKIQMAPRASLLVVGEGPPGGSLEFALHDECIAGLYGWSGSILTIFNEHHEQIWHCDIAAPSLP